MKHILVVDDELGSRESLKIIFSNAYAVSVTENAQEALIVLSRQKVDVVLLDVIMPERDGLSLLKEIHEVYPDTPVVMISASTSVRPVVEAIRDGAYDFLGKPFDVDEIRRIVGRAVERTVLHRKVKNLESEVSRRFPIDGIIGGAPSFKKALDDAGKAASTDSTVLICGESGTGKELAARLIHAVSNRNEEPFVAVHCGSLSESLMDAELFGHEKGAFTNATERKMGRFDLAGNGTLFFDEVSEMTMATQVKLLRVLQEREFMRVGGTRVIRTNARILAATNKNLREEVLAGRFRDDLFYRLSVVPITLPPLRERREDIPALAAHFLNECRANMDVATEGIDRTAMDSLCRYDWPGNVRELRNIIERLLVLHAKEPVITRNLLPEEFHQGPRPSLALSTGLTLHEAVSTYERQFIEQALKQAQGVQTTAAELLGTTRRILRYRMEKLDIPPNVN